MFQSYVKKRKEYGYRRKRSVLIFGLMLGLFLRHADVSLEVSYVVGGLCV